MLEIGCGHIQLVQAADTFSLGRTGARASERHTVAQAAAARRSQAGAVVSVSRGAGGAAACGLRCAAGYAQAPKIGCTAGRVSFVSLLPCSPTHPDPPVSARVLTCCLPSRRTPTKSPVLLPDSIAGRPGTLVWYSMAVWTARTERRLLHAGRLECTLLGVRRNSMRRHDGAALQGQGYGSKTWPKVVLQS